MGNTNFNQKDRWDLNHDNIERLKKECLPNPNTKPENIKLYCFADKEAAPYCKFEFSCDQAGLNKNSERIRFMLGQLLAVHQDEPVMELGSAMKKFNGIGLDGSLTLTAWTDDLSDLLYLFTFAHGCNLIPQFTYRPMLDNKGKPTGTKSPLLTCSILEFGKLVHTEPPAEREPADD